MAVFLGRVSRRGGLVVAGAVVWRGCACALVLGSRDGCPVLSGRGWHVLSGLCLVAPGEGAGHVRVRLCDHPPPAAWLHSCANH